MLLRLDFFSFFPPYSFSLFFTYFFFSLYFTNYIILSCWERKHCRCTQKEVLTNSPCGNMLWYLPSCIVIHGDPNSIPVFIAALTWYYLLFTFRIQYTTLQIMVNLPSWIVTDGDPNSIPVLIYCCLLLIPQISYL